MPSPPTYEKFLLNLTWRNLQVPITNLETSFSQSLAEHKFPDRDGVFVESTGRDAIKVSAKCLFHNHISPTQTETWEYGKLFPYHHEKFLKACVDRSTGTLIHPYLGAFDAKVVSWSSHLDATSRGGATVDIVWTDTILPDPAANSTEADISFPAAEAFSNELAIVRQKKIIPIPADTPTDFLQELRKIKGFIDSTALAVQKALASINRVIYHVNNVIFAVNKANDVTLGELKRKAKAFRASLETLRRDLNALPFLPKKTYVTSVDTTLGELVRILKNPLVTLIKLNPNTVKQPVIRALTPIVYYEGFIRGNI